MNVTLLERPVSPVHQSGTEPLEMPCQLLPPARPCRIALQQIRLAERISRRRFTIGAGGLALAALVGCGQQEQATQTTPATSDVLPEPIVIQHAFGSTEVTKTPSRVVTLGWGPTEAALAVGVVPVAIPRGTGNGGDKEGYHPWVREYFARTQQPLPEVLSTNAGDPPPFEEILTYEPDLILATEAGLTRKQYDTLSAMAPTIAHPGEAWETPWRDTIAISGRALGKEAEAEQVLRDLDAKTAASAAAHPEFKGRSITVAEVYEGEFLIYTAAEPRGKLLTQLGFTVDSYGSSDTVHELSFEKADTIGSDVLLMYFPDGEARQDFESGPAARVLSPRLRDGRIASVVGAANVAAVSPPTALSWPWTIDEFTSTLSAAAKP